ncbi:MAG TPA: hypothetical protein VFH68_25740 [Polyangia bacterium]|nr:hypothetical protein [Polyangia bacterium]
MGDDCVHTADHAHGSVPVHVHGGDHGIVHVDVHVDVYVDVDVIVHGDFQLCTGR